MSGFSADVTPVILTRDEEPNIGRTLGQLSWAREVVVVDSGSTDRTAAIANSFPNVRFVERPFDDHASQWTYATSLAATNWVLTLDADYFVTDEVAAELDMLDRSANQAWESRFSYAIKGHRLRASLYPPRVVLLRRGTYEFHMDGHTQRTRVQGSVGRLRNPIIHDDRKSFSQFVERQRRYMRREAAKIRSGDDLRFTDRVRKLRVIAPFAVVVHALFVKGLIFDGWPGLVYVWERFVAECILARELMRRKQDG